MQGSDLTKKTPEKATDKFSYGLIYSLHTSADTGRQEEQDASSSSSHGRADTAVHTKNIQTTDIRRNKIMTALSRMHVCCALGRP